jgi:hypothetical protein
MLLMHEGEAPRSACLLRNEAEMLQQQDCPYFVPRHMLRKRVYLEHVHGEEAQKFAIPEHPGRGDCLPGLQMLQICPGEMLIGLGLRGVQEQVVMLGASRVETGSSRLPYTSLERLEHDLGGML